MTCNLNIPLKRHYKPPEIIGAVSQTHCTFISKLEERNTTNDVYETEIMLSTSAVRMRIVILPSRQLVTCTSETELKCSCVLCVRVYTFYLMLCRTWLEPGINMAFGLLHAGWPLMDHTFLLLQISSEMRHQTHAVEVKAVLVSRGQYIIMSFICVWFVYSL